MNSAAVETASMMRIHKYDLVVRRRAAPSRTMAREGCVAPSFETLGFAGLFRIRTQCLCCCRHCEERSDEDSIAVRQPPIAALDIIAQ
ncbi:hypothetical protein DY468_11410 [Rhodopseudomonas sp. BR0M22]|nr:hypothetical protein [Rhodopseudomonas sp. BR0M22]